MGGCLVTTNFSARVDAELPGNTYFVAARTRGIIIRPRGSLFSSFKVGVLWRALVRNDQGF